MFAFHPLFQYNKDMRKYEEGLGNSSRLQQLLLQRKMPLSNEGLQRALEELTVFMTSDVLFFCAVYPKKDPMENCGDVDKADMMLGSDDEKYFPVFSDISRLKEFKPVLQKGEEIYVFDKKDLLQFLQINKYLAAVVLNPQEDDLLLHRLLLQNLIQVEADNTSKM